MVVYGRRLDAQQRQRLVPQRRRQGELHRPADQELAFLLYIGRVGKMPVLLAGLGTVHLEAAEAAASQVYPRQKFRQQFAAGLYLRLL